MRRWILFFATGAGCICPALSSCGTLVGIDEIDYVPAGGGRDAGVSGGEGGGFDSGHEEFGGAAGSQSVDGSGSSTGGSTAPAGGADAGHGGTASTHADAPSMADAAGEPGDP